MSIPDLSPIAVFEGDDSRGPFPFVDDGVSIPYASTSHLYLARVSPTGTHTPLAIEVDFTIDGTLGTESGLYTGEITLTAEQDTLAAADGDTPAERLICYRLATFDQTWALTYNQRFPSETFTRLQNKLVMALQDLRTLVLRAPLLPAGDDPVTFGDKLTRKGKVVGFDANSGVMRAMRIGETADANGEVLVQEFRFSASADQVAFTLSGVRVDDEASVLVWVGGAIQGVESYSLGLVDEDTVLTLGSAPGLGVGVLVRVMGSQGVTDIGVAAEVVPFLQESTKWELTAEGGLMPWSLRKRAAAGYDLRDFGRIVLSDSAYGNDNGDTINTALAQVKALGGGRLNVPRGTIFSSAITLRTLVKLRGDGKYASFIKAKPSLNANFVEGEDTAALWAGTAPGGLYDAGFSHLTFDGNRANQASGDLVRIFGRALEIEHFGLTGAKGASLQTKYGNPGLLGAPVERGVENFIRHGYINFGEREGWIHSGSNDSHHDNIIIASVGLAGDNLYDGLVCTGDYGHAKWTCIHVWRWSPGSYTGMKYQRYALRNETPGSEFVNCDFEGAYTANVYCTARARFEQCSAYAVRNGGANIITRVSGVTWDGGSLEGPESGTCKGIVLGTDAGDLVQRCRFVTQALGQEAGVVDWTHSDGYNEVDTIGDSAGVLEVGTKQPTDSFRYSLLNGSTGERRGVGVTYSFGHLRPSLTTGITAAGTTQSDATELAADLDIHYVGTVAPGTGVRLRNYGIQARITVINDGANPLRLYPAVGHTFSGLAANAPLILAPGTSREVEQVAADYVVPVAGDLAHHRAYTTWTPTLSYPGVAPTTATVAGRYKRMGRTLLFNIDYNISSLGSGSGNIEFLLPESVSAQVLTPVSGYNNAAGSVQAAMALGTKIILVPTPAMAANNYFVGGSIELNG